MDNWFEKLLLYILLFPLLFLAGFLVWRFVLAILGLPSCVDFNLSEL